MADATRTTRSVDEDVVTLTMTVDEAKTLRALLFNVGGCPYDSPRKHSSSISGALDSAGIPVGGSREARNLLSGSVYFAPYPNGADRG